MPRISLIASSLFATSLTLTAQEPRILRHAGDSIGPANLVSFELLSAEQVADFPVRGKVLLRAATDAPAASDEMLLRIARDETAGTLLVALDLREGDRSPVFPPPRCAPSRTPT